MDIAAIEARKQDLLAQQARVVADLNAITGALQDCEYWYNQIVEEAAAQLAAEAAAEGPKLVALEEANG